ncbi:GPI mannosyltransferase 3 [Leptidea sinapis]|uniref:GPI mannosyltransferase 3 n=1 Tax=Leptidea sinapis TaxID=189913 RepID=UPI00212B05B9|nr:GPI mannosyltransferase 3 [Leptidea sinapis]
MALASGLRPLQVFILLLSARILSVFLVQTWYVPDEYWQTLEVAHKHVFGYGELTWEWQKGIRSYLYPSVVSAIYYALKLTSLDYPTIVVLAPRIFQAVLSAFADYSFYKWSGNRKWALFVILTSWFWFYTASRTLLQTTETALVAIALSMFPFKAGKPSYYEKEDNRWVWIACVSVFVRPTSAPLWIVLSVYNLMTTNKGPLKQLLSTYLPIGILSSGVLIGLDSFMYDRLIVTPWEFFKVNIIQDISSFYGEHPWYWYLTQGLPAVLGISLPLVLWGILAVVRRPKEHIIGVVILTAAAFHIILHSLISHKEFRFVLPLLPMLMYLAQDVIVPWSRKAKKWQLYTLAGLLVVGNVAPAFYFGTVHQSGPLRVMPLLREEIKDNKTSVLFLMPCHSTPLYSHLHANITTRYLHCEPTSANTEAENFYNNPLSWWRSELARKQPYTLVVMFDVLRGRLETVLADYELLYDVPHTELPEGEVSEKILVFRKLNKRTVQPDPVV